jgi:hypothetical protein
VPGPVYPSTPAEIFTSCPDVPCPSAEMSIIPVPGMVQVTVPDVNLTTVPLGSVIDALTLPPDPPVADPPVPDPPVADPDVVAGELDVRTPVVEEEVVEV